MPSRVSIWLFFSLFALFFLTSSGGFESGEAYGRYETAKSLVAGRGGALEADAPLSALVTGRNGKGYVAYGPFQSLLMAPLILATNLTKYAAAKKDSLNRVAFNLGVLPAVSALALTLVFSALLLMGYSSGASLFSIFVLALATPLWHYARSAQEENLLALGFALWLWGIACFQKKSAWGLTAAALGGCIALATRWLAVAPLLPLIGLSLFILAGNRGKIRRAPLVISLLACAGTVGGLLWFNHFRFGSVWETGYGLLYPDVAFFSFDEFLPRSLALLFSPHRGLFWFAPVALIFLFPSVVRRALPPYRSSLSLLRAAGPAAMVCVFLVNASYFYWSGGFAWGPRFLVAPFILFAPLIADLPRLFAHQVWERRLGHFLIGLSAAVQFCSVVLPASTEEVIREGAGASPFSVADAWKCKWTPVCLRPGMAAAAIANTAADYRGLTVSFEATGQGSAWESSDFHTIFWWPFRFTFRFEAFSWGVAVALFTAGAALTLWLLYRLLKEVSPTPDRAPSH